MLAIYMYNTSTHCVHDASGGPPFNPDLHPMAHTHTRTHTTEAERDVSQERASEWCKSIHKKFMQGTLSVPYFETSARIVGEAASMAEVMAACVKLARARDVLIEEKQGDGDGGDDEETRLPPGRRAGGAGGGGGGASEEKKDKCTVQ